jgi:hypothetical protein
MMRWVYDAVASKTEARGQLKNTARKTLTPCTFIRE